MGIDVMIVGRPEGIARPNSLEIMEWLLQRWQEYALPYGFIDFDEGDIGELETRFSNDPVAQILLKKIQAAKEYVGTLGRDLDLPYTIELMISY